MGRGSKKAADELLCYVTSEDKTAVRRVGLPEAMTALDDPNCFVWIDLLAPRRDVLERLVSRLGFHELAVEDVSSPQSRAKVEEYEGHLFCVAPALNKSTPDDLFDIVNLNGFLGPNYLITTHREEITATSFVAECMDKGDPPLLRGPDFVLYQQLDRLVDEYLDLSNELNDSVEVLEKRIFGPLDAAIPQSIFQFKHQAALLRRRVGPLREILNFLTNRPHDLVKRDTQLYLRDVYDHVYRISEGVDSLRDLLQGALDAYLSTVANRSNEVMKVLTVVATIVLPLNVLTGLFGTNFNTLPGAESPYGFWVFCGVLLIAGLASTILFRFRRWL